MASARVTFMSLPAFLDLRHKHTPLQALGFYAVAFMSVALLSVAIVTVIARIAFDAQTMQKAADLGIQVASVMSSLGSLLVCALVLWKKGLLKQIDSVAIILISGFLGFFGGTLLGMIIPALMTVRPAKKA